MMRHTPTLYPHPERDGDSDDEDGWDGADVPFTSVGTALSPPSVPPQLSAPTASSSRIRFQSRDSYIGHPNGVDNSAASRAPATPAYSDLYSQFVQRYRNTGAGQEQHYGYYGGRSTARHDPDSDEDDDENRPSDLMDRMSALRLAGEEDDDAELAGGEASAEHRERLEWQTMLASVLGGDVLRGEKTRIAGSLESGKEEQHLRIWMELRAKVHGRTEPEERRRVEEKRIRIVDAAIAHVNDFCVRPGSDSSEALEQVQVVLDELDKAHALYPTLKAFYTDKPAALDRAFQARCDTLHTWATVLVSLRTQLARLRTWTGSDTLDVTEPTGDPTEPSAAEVITPGSNNGTGNATPGERISFVDRVLKEDSAQRTFEKGFLTTVHALIGNARDAQVNLAPFFALMALPTFEPELVPLISFPTRLVQAILRVRLDYATKLRDPELLIIEQIADDLRVNIGLACTLKRQYESFLAPDAQGHWTLPTSLSPEYDQAVLDALAFFFQLVHWKLKSGSKSVYFKETEMLDGHWATFNDVSLSTAGGSRLVAEQLCVLTYKLLDRITSYFDQQIRLPVSDEPVAGLPAQAAAMNPIPGAPVNSAAAAAQAALKGAAGDKRKKMTDTQLIQWYSKLLEAGRLRHRRLHRFARALGQRFANSAEYTLEGQDVPGILAALVETDHFLVWTQTGYMEDGVYLLASACLRERPEMLRRIVSEAFHVREIVDEVGVTKLVNTGDPAAAAAMAIEDEDEDMPYVLVLTPQTGFVWNGLTVFLDVPKVDLGIEDGRLRLIADGSGPRLEAAKDQFAAVFEPYDESSDEASSGGDDSNSDGDGAHSSTSSRHRPPPTPMPPVVEEQRAHLTSVYRKLRKIQRAVNKLAELTVDSVHVVRRAVRGVEGHQDLLEGWFGFASEHGAHAHKHTPERAHAARLARALVSLAIAWVAFICDECDPGDRKTFRWAVNALEFALARTRRTSILRLPADEFGRLRQKVASCMTLLIAHFDILGARSSKEKERQEELLRSQTLAKARDAESDGEDEADGSGDGGEGGEGVVGEDTAAGPTHDAFLSDRAVRAFWTRTSAAIAELEEGRATINSEQHLIGRVLEDRPEHRSLNILAGSAANIGIKWQQGRFIGAGAFGSVYLAVNLDSGSLMAVKEIRFQDLSGAPTLINQIRDELAVMELLHHPNVVEYYGIEVHRDKVYIFEEYCQGGSLAQLLEHGRIEEEGIIQVYTLQLLEGLTYLHSQNVVHRDIKPDNILLDHMGVIKYVDFGAAKVLAKNHRTMMRSRRPTDTPPVVSAPPTGPNGPGGQLPMMAPNSLTGTPMYMSPEVIKNDKRGRRGAMDIWALGCVVLEFATGRKPWSNLDNEWAIMFHIGVAREHPPLPEPHQLSEVGIDFIRQCLTIDPMLRPSAEELMSHPWMLDFRAQLRSYEEAELADPPAELPAEEEYESATVARQAAILQEREVEEITAPSPRSSPAGTPPEEA